VFGAGLRDSAFIAANPTFLWKALHTFTWDMNIIAAFIKKLAAAQLNNVKSINQSIHRQQLTVAALMLLAKWSIPNRKVFNMTLLRKRNGRIIVGLYRGIHMK
jgi:hypothetical protein